MLHEIQTAVLDLWQRGRKIKSSPSGWLSGNAVCCVYNGESADTRGRGGILAAEDGSVTWHCFNCNFKAGYQPGKHLGYKFRKLLTWMGADENTVRRLVFTAVRLKDHINPNSEGQADENQEKISFNCRALPEQAKTLLEWAAFYELKEWSDVPDEFHLAVKYANLRALDLKRYDFYWTPETAYNLHRRLIIPFTWQNQIIGYSARSLSEDIKPKYFSQIEPNYVFNTDKQLHDSKFVIVCEGPLDAISLDGVAVLGNNCTEVQADIIDSLQREVIVVPDADRAGKNLIAHAIEYGWTVSFPVWQEKYKDINSAVQHLGRLFVLKSILDARETSRLKIELRSKKLYN